MGLTLKLLGVLAAVVLTLMVAAQLLLVAPLRQRLAVRVGDEVISASEQAAALHQADVLAVRHLAEDLAAQGRLAQALSIRCGDVADQQGCLTRRHRDGASALEAWWLTTQAALGRNRGLHLGAREAGAVGVEPTLVMACDASGIVVARTVGDVADWWGPQVINLVNALPVAAEAAHAAASRHDVVAWHEGAGETPTLVAVAPIRSDDGPLMGLALVGIPLSDGLARDEAAVLGEPGLAFTLGADLAGTSLPAETVRELEGATFTHGGRSASLAELLQPGESGAAWVGEGAHQAWEVSWAPFASGRADAMPAGALAVVSRSAALAGGGGAALSLVLLAILVAALGALLISVLMRGFTAPLARVEHGIQQVLAGNRDYVWMVDKGRPHAALAQALNAMSAYLQGKQPAEEEPSAADSEWAAMLQIEASGPRRIVDAEPAASGEADAEGPQSPAEGGATAEGRLEADTRRLYDAWVAARQRVGAAGAGMSYERFAEQIQRSTDTLKQKHGVRDVRFEVAIKGDQVVLKPIPVR